MKKRGINESTPLRLIEALKKYPKTSIFAVLDSDIDDKKDWEVQPIDAVVLSESTSDEYYLGQHFIIKAKNILVDGTIRDCYIDMNLPERISDFVFFRRGKSLEVRYYRECEGEIICAVPIDCYGVYEQFYSKIAPDIGIDILKQGLALSERKECIAEDLGYILRDENRFKEAAEMFQIAVDEGPSSYFIYGELAGCYKEIGQLSKARKYQKMYQNLNELK